MVGARHLAAILAAAWLLGATPCGATPADTSGTLYVLATPPSSLQSGCRAPCTCPIDSLPTYGSFQLVRTGVDPLYTHYAVQGFIASFNNGPGAVSIVGSGEYRIGGEVALVQELTLDLEIWGRPPQHFDSGLQPVRTPFPQIDVSAAVNGFACLDSILVVSAKPVISADTGPQAPARFGVQAVQPNPFRGRTLIAFAIDRPGPVELSVVDAQGRRVRSLASGSFAAAGPQMLAWDGRSDDGRPAPAGVYWVRLRWAGGTDSRRFVKLE